MDAVGVRDRGRLDDLVDREIALARRRRTDEISLVGNADVQRSGIGLRVDRNDAHAEALRRARNAHGDLAAIGDQNRAEHGKVLAQGRAEWHGPLPGCPQAEITAWRPD